MHTDPRTPTRPDDPRTAAPTCRGDHTHTRRWRDELRAIKRLVGPTHRAATAGLDRPRAGMVPIERIVADLIGGHRAAAAVLGCPCALVDHPSGFTIAAGHLHRAAASAVRADASVLTATRRDQLARAVQIHGDAMYQALDAAQRTPEPGSGLGVLLAYEALDLDELLVLLRAASNTRRERRWRAHRPSGARGPCDGRTGHPAVITSPLGGPLGGPPGRTRAGAGAGR